MRRAKARRPARGGRAAATPWGEVWRTLERRLATYGLVLVSACLLTTVSCGETHRPDRSADADPAFRVSEPSRLFFLNVRAANYYQTRPRGTEVDLYRSRKFSQTQRRPVLVPTIVHAYLKNEAYLFVQPNDFPGLADPLTVAWESADSSGAYRLDVPTRPAQLAFAIDLYERMLDGHRLAVVLADSSRVPVFETRTERSQYLGVMQDYFRLTDRI